MEGIITKFMPELTSKFGKIYYRGITNKLDWVYYDNDKLYELYSEAENDESKIAKEINKFVEYTSNRFKMNEHEKELLDYLIRGFDWDDSKYCMDILINDEPNDVHEFLQKYNFKFYSMMYYEEEKPNK